jgi:hypothetical protein
VLAKKLIINPDGVDSNKDGLSMGYDGAVKVKGEIVATSLKIVNDQNEEINFSDRVQITNEGLIITSVDSSDEHNVEYQTKTDSHGLHLFKAQTQVASFGTNKTTLNSLNIGGIVVRQTPTHGWIWVDDV